MSMPPGVLDQYFEMTGDTVQNVEIKCIKCPKRDTPLIYLDTYDETPRPFSTKPEVTVVQTISGMLEAMWTHIAYTHLEEVR